MSLKTVSGLSYNDQLVVHLHMLPLIRGVGAVPSQTLAALLFAHKPPI